MCVRKNLFLKTLDKRFVFRYSLSALLTYNVFYYFKLYVDSISVSSL